MADQHNANIPAVGNVIASDIPDIKENLEYHKDVFENFVKTWSNTDATGVYPHKFSDQSGTPVVLQCTVLDIGDWDMDATATLAVSHGLTLSKIRSVSGLIRNDANDAFFILVQGYGSADEFHANINSINATQINLLRRAGGDFDSTSFNSTSYNRGYLFVWHTV